MQKPSDPQSLDQKLLTALARIGTALRASAWRGAQERGLSPTQGAMLTLLLSRGVLRPSEIAEHMQVTKPTASAVLRTLVEKELVQIAEDPADGRSRSVTLTRKGRREVKHVLAWPNSLVRPLASLASESRAVLLRNLVALLVELERVGLLAPARTCPTCVHFRVEDHPSGSGRFCTLLGTRLLDSDLRVECPEHVRAGAGRTRP